ncbi:MAG: ATPase, partial [Gammaproteobacteria bacterium]|nr:ATPase [Gammaproteobacteria bacterium]
MKFTVDEFRAWKNKKITLLGMSGVGKTYLSALLRESNWFHFSGDYRIGTRYLDEPIMDMIKQQAMQVPFLKDLLRRDWIYIRNNIKVHDLGPVLSYIGKLGNPELGGVELDDFIKRQALYREAEIATMYDV